MTQSYTIEKEIETSSSLKNTYEKSILNRDHEIQLVAGMDLSSDPCRALYHSYPSRAVLDNLSILEIDRWCRFFQFEQSKSQLGDGQRAGW